MTKPRTQWIAERTLNDGLMRRLPVVVRLGLPQMVSAEEWVCPIEIAHGEDKIGMEAHGIDSFQALRLGMEAIRIELLKRFPAITWLSGEYGDTGFGMEVPGHYGRDFARYLELLIEAETLRSGDEFRRRSARQREASSGSSTAKQRTKVPRGTKR